jgi:hypothetical protein
MKPLDYKKKSAIIASALLAGMVVLFSFLIWQDVKRPLADMITENFTPPQLLGVPEDHVEVAQVAYAAFPREFMADAQAEMPDHSRDNARLWDIVRKVDIHGKPAGNDIGCGPQQTGDCVSWGLARAITMRLCIQKYKGHGDDGSLVFQPYIYGVARVNSGKAHFSCSSGGAYPSVAAQSLAEWGYACLDDDPPPYTGALADNWGCHGVPDHFVKLAKKRAGGAVYPIRSTDELRDAICNGYPCTIAVTFSPGQKYVADGRGCLKWDGPVRGGHQMCVTAYDGSVGPGHEYFYIQNSHGPHAQAACDPMQNEPLGGFWIPLKLCEKWLQSGESWAVSDVAGFRVDNEIDWSVFDQFRAQAKPIVPANKGNNHEVKNGRGLRDNRSVVLAP